MVCVCVSESGHCKQTVEASPLGESRLQYFSSISKKTVPASTVGKRLFLTMIILMFYFLALPQKNCSNATKEAGRYDAGVKIDGNF